MQQSENIPACGRHLSRYKQWVQLNHSGLVYTYMGIFKSAFFSASGLKKKIPVHTDDILKYSHPYATVRQCQAHGKLTGDDITSECNDT